MFFNFWQHYQVMEDHSKVIKKHFWMLQRAKNVFFGLRSVGSTWYCIFRIKDGANNLASIWHMLDHSKVTILHFWMIQSATWYCKFTMILKSNDSSSLDLHAPNLRSRSVWIINPRACSSIMSLNLLVPILENWTKNNFGPWIPWNFDAAGPWNLPKMLLKVLECP